MFSVRFRRRVRRRRHRRRNDFCFSRQNRLSFTLDIWDKESIGLGQMYWMTFRWPWLKVTAVTLINKNLLVCRIKWEPLNQSLQNLVAISPWSWLSPDQILEEFCWKFLFCQIFLENFGCVFSRSNTLLDISQEWLVRLMWNEKEVHWLDTG